MRFVAIRNALVVSVFVALACGGASAQCTPEWARGMFPDMGLSCAVRAMCVHNGQLYAGTQCNVAKWNGASWQAVGAGMTDYSPQYPHVAELCVNDFFVYARLSPRARLIFRSYLRGIPYHEVCAHLRITKNQHSAIMARIKRRIREFQMTPHGAWYWCYKADVSRGRRSTSKNNYRPKRRTLG